MSETPYFVIDTHGSPVEKRSSGMTLLSSATSGDQRSQTAAVVSVKQALSYPPVFAGITLISGDVSTFPWETKKYIDKDRGTTENAESHPTYGLLRKKTGDTDQDITANKFIEAITARALFYGIGAARIYRSGTRGMNRPKRLELISNTVKPVDRYFRGQRFKFYEYTDDEGKFHQVRPSDMLVLDGPTMDGWNGMGLYDYARGVIGRALAASNYSDEFFTGGAVPQGWFVHPGEMSDEAQRRFISAVETRHRFRRAWGVLEDDVKWIPSAVNPNDAMLVSLLEFSAGDVARFLKLPADKLGVDMAGKAPAKSVEQSQKNYLLSCLNYWLRRLEQEADDKMFREDEKDDHFTKFNTKHFLQSTATLSEQKEADVLDVMNGMRTINEIRVSRGDLPYEDEAADKPLLPLNMTTNPANLDQETTPDSQETPETPPSEPESPQNAPDSAGDTEDERSQTRLNGLPEAQEKRSLAVEMAQRDVLQDALRRMAIRIHGKAERRANDPHRYMKIIDDLEVDNYRTITIAIRPAMSLLAVDRGIAIDQYTADTTQHLLSKSRAILLEASECRPDQLRESVQSKLEAMITSADEIANGFFRHTPGGVDHDQMSHGRKGDKKETGKKIPSRIQDWLTPLPDIEIEIEYGSDVSEVSGYDQLDEHEQDEIRTNWEQDNWDDYRQRWEEDRAQDLEYDVNQSPEDYWDEEERLVSITHAISEVPELDESDMDEIEFDGNGYPEARSIHELLQRMEANGDISSETAQAGWKQWQEGGGYESYDEDRDSAIRTAIDNLLITEINNGDYVYEIGERLAEDFWNLGQSELDELAQDSGFLDTDRQVDTDEETVRGMEANFKLEDGREFHADFQYENRLPERIGSNGWVSQFMFEDPHGSYSATGNGSAKEVFRKAAKTLSAFIQQDNGRSDVIYYTSSGKSRSDLYEFLTKQFSKHLPGWTGGGQHNVTSGVFGLVKDEIARDVMVDRRWEEY